MCLIFKNVILYVIYFWLIQWESDQILFLNTKTMYSYYQWVLIWRGIHVMPWSAHTMDILPNAPFSTEICTWNWAYQCIFWYTFWMSKVQDCGSSCTGPPWIVSYKVLLQTNCLWTIITESAFENIQNYEILTTSHIKYKYIMLRIS